MFPLIPELNFPAWKLQIGSFWGYNQHPSQRKDNWKDGDPSWWICRWNGGRLLQTALSAWQGKTSLDSWIMRKQQHGGDTTAKLRTACPLRTLSKSLKHPGSVEQTQPLCRTLPPRRHHVASCRPRPAGALWRGPAELCPRVQRGGVHLHPAAGGHDVRNTHLQTLDDEGHRKSWRTVELQPDVQGLDIVLLLDVQSRSNCVPSRSCWSSSESIVVIPLDQLSSSWRRCRDHCNIRDLTTIVTLLYSFGTQLSSYRFTLSYVFVFSFLSWLWQLKKVKDVKLSWLFLYAVPWFRGDQ